MRRYEERIRSDREEWIRETGEKVARVQQEKEQAE